MRYNYTKVDELGGRRDSPFTRVEEINDSDVSNGFSVIVEDNLNTTSPKRIICSPDALESWKIGQERANQWRPDIKEPTYSEEIVKDAVKPSHHQEFMPGMQWLDATSMNVRYRNRPEAMVAAVELQIRKYLDRNGRKDGELQEFRKALWYLIWVCAFLELGPRKDIGNICHAAITRLDELIKAFKNDK